MRICLLTSSYPNNPEDASAAAGMFVRQLALTLTKKGHEIVVHTQLRPGQAIEDDPEIRVNRFSWTGGDKRLSTLGVRNIIDVLSVMWSGATSLAALASRFRPHLMVAMWAVPCGAWAYAVSLVGENRPYVVWTLGSDIWIYGRRRYSRGIISIVLNKAACVFSDGIELARETASLTTKSVEFLPTTRVLPKSGLPSLSLDPERSHYVYIGRFHPHKGVDILIDAISLLPAEVRRRIQFHMCGDGELEKEVRQSVDGKGLKEAVALHGYVAPATAAAFLSIARFLIIPSRIESIPVVMSDALQMGCPLIVTDVGDMGEIVRRHKIGFVAQPSDPASLAAAIVDSLEIPRTMYEENLRTACALFDIDRIADRIVSEAANVTSGEKAR